MVRIAGIGELIFSQSSDDILKTFALSSCVAVIAYNSLRRKAGLIHIALPCSDNIDDIKKRPHYYAETGVPLLIESMCRKFVCSKDDLTISLYGGAISARKDDIFNIGVRNLQAVRRILNNYNLKINANEIGGKLSRTVEIDVATGLIKVKSQPINF
ncbi:MAG: cheD1 [Clostridia bacterium]|jgi:chemotaxis protein CheD|nr:cheD1 [Clostridia bacterium]